MCFQGISKPYRWTSATDGISYQKYIAHLCRNNIMELAADFNIPIMNKHKGVGLMDKEKLSQYFHCS